MVYFFTIFHNIYIHLHDFFFLIYLYIYMFRYIVFFNIYVYIYILLLDYSLPDEVNL
jgi:hypothetical protein